MFLIFFGYFYSVSITAMQKVEEQSDVNLFEYSKEEFFKHAQTNGLNILMQDAPKKIEYEGKYIVIIIIDACSPEYFYFSKIPNITKLMSEGVSYTNAWVGQMINNTPPSHATIATGMFPKNSGIYSFNWRDAKTRQPVRPTGWESVTSGKLTEIMKQKNATGIASQMKKKHPNIKVASIGSDKYYAVG